MQQHLEAKRGALEKSLEQLVGQINRVNGAIAVVDELIADQDARDSAALAKEAAALFGEPVDYGGIDRAPSQHWKAHPVGGCDVCAVPVAAAC